MTIKRAARHTTRARSKVTKPHPWGSQRLALVLAGIVLLLASQPLDSQQPAAGSQQPPAIQQPIAVQVKVVNVLATVRDKHGNIVRGLTRNDFTLEEDGRPQEIRYFSQESDLPLTLGLLVDTSMSQRRVLGQERDASATFLDQVLRVGKDQAFVIHFDREVELLQDLTSSREKLQAALNLLQTPQRSQQDRGDPPDPGSQQWPRGGGREGGGRGGWRGGGTLLYDAVYLASKDVMAKQTGRKALIVLSDGVDRGSKKTLASAIEAAQRANTLVYSILFTDEQGYGGGGYGHHHMGGMGGMGGPMGPRGGGYPRYPQEARPDGKKILAQLSKQTGGRLFEVSSKHPIEASFAEIQEELRNQYNLGYTPDRPLTEPGYRKITLTANKKDLIVQARDGYYVGQ
jgi:VWFA-related protein